MLSTRSLLVLIELQIYFKENNYNILPDLFGKCVFVYIDHMLVYIEQYHVTHLQLVFDQLRKAGQAKPTNVHFVYHKQNC